MKRMPAIKENKAIARKFEKKLKKFSKSCVDSFEYWLMAKIKKSKGGYIMQGGKRVTLLKAIEAELADLEKEWDAKSEDIALKYAKANSNEIFSYVNFRMKRAGFGNINIDDDLKQQITADIENASAMIKSIPRDILERFKNTILTSLTNLDAQKFKEKILAIGGISERRASLIARDQTYKALSSIVAIKAKSAGASFYEWVTAGDERVSTGDGGHKYLNGRIYSYDEDTAIIDSYGTKGRYGERVNCRCVGVSVFLDDNEEVRRVTDSKRGDYYIVIKKR